MNKHIVFDVDRTIINSFESEILSLNDAIELVTGEKVDREILKKITTMPTYDFFKSLNLPKEMIDDINKKWDITYYNYDIVCFPKIKDVIKELHNMGYAISIITSRTSSEYHGLDNELNDIAPLISVLVTSDLVEKPKPAADSFNYLIDKLKCTNNDIIYIGDSNVDKDFANNSNVAFIPACWENKELINEDNACTNISNLISIISIIK